MPKLEVTEELLAHIATLDPAGLAYIVRLDWPKPYYAAAPYLEAMAVMTSFHENYMAEDGRWIALKFVNNAKTYKGPVAKAVKARIEALLKEKKK